MTTNNRPSRRTLRLGVFVCFLALMLTSNIRAQQAALHGTVLDSTGAPIQGAEIEFNSGTNTTLTTTDAQGKFSLGGVEGNGTLLARYPGFSPVSVSIGPDSYQQDLELRLSPAPSSERIQVSAAGQDRIPPVPTSEFRSEERRVGKECRCRGSGYE